MISPLLAIIIAGSFIAAAGGALGAFALLRRMTLVGDAMAHIALPGIALALLWNINPFFGGLFFLVAGALFIWIAERKTNIGVETIVGVVFSMALGLGALLTPEHELLEALFGDLTQLSLFDAVFASVVSLLLIVTLLVLSKKLTLTLISQEISRSVGLNPALLELLYLLIFAVTVALGIKFTGLLLMGALIIMPAAIARNLATSMRSYLAVSVCAGVLGAIVSILISLRYAVSPGPVFALLLGSVFFLSITARRQKRA
ncbi:MAG: metal ABC transporter permease [Candidatus Wildermuthbacteria bacterium]|nr:metal ABC transporter permease [Candidatus Wildermuthbacteria bacterium]